MAESLLVGRNFMSDICKLKNLKNLKTYKKTLAKNPRFLPALVLSINMMMHIFHYFMSGVSKHVTCRKMVVMSSVCDNEFQLLR